MRELLGGIGALAAIVVIVVGLAFGGYWMTRYFAPKYEQVRREVYEESQAYVRGKAEHLNRLRLDYMESADDTHRALLRRTILNEVGSFDRSKLPAELRAFIEGLERGTS